MTPEQAQAIYLAGQAAVVTHLCDLDTQVAASQLQIEELQRKIARLSKNSANSSKRPSSDDITKPKDNKKTQGTDGKGKGKKIGGQPGHPKHTRAPYPPEAISDIHEYESPGYPHCGAVDIAWVEDQPPRVIQQAEVKEIVVTHEEHRADAYWCEACGQMHDAEFPPEVLAEGLFKARITALVAFMKNVCHASFSTIRKCFRDVLGEPVSRGYLSKIIQKVSQSLERPYEELLERIPLETKLNVDETGHKDNGQRFWTWVFKAELYVLFRIDKSRGSKVLIDVSGREFEGTSGCDYFSAYRKFMKDFDVPVQFCIAHLIRDIKFLTTLPDAPTRADGEKLLHAVKAMFKVIHQHETLTPQAFQAALEQAKARIIHIAINEVPSLINAKGKEQKREAQNMANRFRKHGKAYFAFILQAVQAFFHDQPPPSLLPEPP